MSSVISASYYLKIIKIIMFDEPNKDLNMNLHSYSTSSKKATDSQYVKPISLVGIEGNEQTQTIDSYSYISPIHAFSIATGTAFLTLFILDSELLINSIELAQFTI